MSNWIRRRERWSSGPSRWEYVFVPGVSEDIDSYIEEASASSSERWWGSDHYRGLDVELVENIAPEILAKHIAEARENVNRAVRWLELLQQE